MKASARDYVYSSSSRCTVMCMHLSYTEIPNLIIYTRCERGKKKIIAPNLNNSRSIFVFLVCRCDARAPENREFLKEKVSQFSSFTGINHTIFRKEHARNTRKSPPRAVHGKSNLYNRMVIL